MQRLLIAIVLVVGLSSSTFAAVAFDAFASSALCSAPCTGPIEWTHTPVGTPKAAIVMMQQTTGGADESSACTYGGTSMTEIAGSPNLKTSTEAMAVHVYFLGASVPTGAQTISCTVTAAGVIKRAASITLTAGADDEMVDTDATINTVTGVDPSVTLQLTGRTSFAAIAFTSGQGVVTAVTELASWTNRLEADFGAQVAGWYTYDTIGTSDVTAGWTQASDDAVAIAFAVSEVVGGGGGCTGTFMTLTGAGCK